MGQELEAITTAVQERMNQVSAIRDRVLGECRQVVRWSANSVRASHRGDLIEAESELMQAKSLAAAIISDTKDYLSIYWAGYVQDAMKEFAEASITRAIILNSSLPTPEQLDVEDAAYLNALAEAASELRRDILDLLRSDDLDRAVHLLGAMDEIYSVLIAIDFPDAITGGLRRTTDALRAVLERTRGDVTITINQRRLEHAVRSMQSNVGTEVDEISSLVDLEE